MIWKGVMFMHKYNYIEIGNRIRSERKKWEYLKPNFLAISKIRGNLLAAGIYCHN